MDRSNKFSHWVEKITDLILWYMLVLFCALIVYAGTYLGDVYRSTWGWPLEGVFWLCTVGFIILLLAPILFLLSFVEMVYIHPTPGQELANCAYIGLILGLLHGVIATPFTEFGPEPWEWASWWSVLPAISGLIFVVFSLCLPDSLRHQAMLEARNRPWYTSVWL